MNAKSIIYVVLSSIYVVPNGNAALAKKKAKMEKITSQTSSHGSHLLMCAAI